MSDQLDPPKRFRKTSPKCCATCIHRIDVDGFPECEREEGRLPDSEEIFFLICSYYKHN